MFSLRERGNVFWFLVCSGIYGTVTAVHAAAKLFWYDELLTLYVSKLDTFGDVWAALTSGFDLNPPLLYIINRALHQVFEPGEVVTRLPSMLGFWVMCLALYVFLKRRLPIPYALAGAAFPLLTGAYPYAYEARPYGILLGFAGITLVFWQRATSSERPTKLDLAGFTISLFLCLMSHCYGVLLLMVFGLTELVRWVRRREIGWDMAFAMFAATLPAMFVYLSLLNASQGVVLGTSNALPRWNLFFHSYILLFTAGAAFGLPIAFTIGRVHPARWSEDSEAEYSNSAFTVEERLLLILLAALPLPALLLSALLVGQYYFRYALPCVIGVSGLVAGRLSSVSRRSQPAGWLIAMVFVAFFLAGVAKDVPKATLNVSKGSESIFRDAHPLLNRPELRNRSLVISNCQDFFQVEHYGRPELIARAVYLVDHEKAIRNTGTDVCENGAEMIAKWFPIRSRIEPYDQFIGNGESFSVYTCSHPVEWLPCQLALDGLEVEPQAADNSCSLLAVHEAGAASWRSQRDDL